MFITKEEDRTITAIAWDGQILASDSWGSSGDLILAPGNQKVFKLSGRLIAAAGNRSDILKFIEWVKSESDKDFPEVEDNFEAIEIIQSAAYLYNKGGQVQIIKPPYAIGCGRELCLGAMSAGANAIGAVQIACRYHAFCGGDIQSERL